MRIFNSLAVATVVVAAAAFIPQTANAERVCRQDYVGRRDRGAWGPT
jgi:hypothetical protein